MDMDIYWLLMVGAAIIIFIFYFWIWYGKSNKKYMDDEPKTDDNKKVYFEEEPVPIMIPIDPRSEENFRNVKQYKVIENKKKDIGKIC